MGRALAALLLKKRDEMHALYGIVWRITGVATRRMGWLAASSSAGFGVASLLSGEVQSEISPHPSNVNEWLRAARCDVLFETTSLNVQTGEPAVSHIRAG